MPVKTGGSAHEGVKRCLEAYISTGMRKTVGIFDSGLGGLTVVRAVRERLPGVDVVYLGDTARVPYGNKSARTVAKYAGTCAAFFAPHSVDLLLVACNTATALGINEVRARTKAHVVGAVVPGAKRAVEVSKTGRVGVLSTLATFNSGVYETEIKRLDERAHVSAIPSPLLVPLAEEGWAEHPVSRQVAMEYVRKLHGQDPGLDVIVLGCTHYPLLASTIIDVAAECFGREIAIVDSAVSMASVAASVLGEGADGSDGQLRCFMTDDSRISDLATRFLGEPLAHLELVDLVP